MYALNYNSRERFIKSKEKLHDNVVKSSSNSCDYKNNEKPSDTSESSSTNSQINSPINSNIESNTGL